MAVTVPIIDTIKAGRRYGLYATPSAEAPEAASQTFKKGAPLKDDGSGYLIEITADDVAGIVGIATEDGHNTANDGDKMVGYVPALPHISFVAVLEDETNENHTLAATDRWQSFALQKDTTSGAWVLDENDTTNVAGRVTRLLDPIGTVKGKVEFVFLVDTTAYGT